MIPEFKAEVIPSEGRAVVAVTGEIDVSTVPALREKVTEAMRLSPHVVVDLSDTSFIDSSGLSALVQARRACRTLDGSVAIRSPQPAVRRILEMTMLDSLISIED